MGSNPVGASEFCLGFIVTASLRYYITLLEHIIGHIWGFSQGRPPHIISRFENEAANTPEGGDLRQLLNNIPRAVLHVSYSHCCINKYEKYISRLT